MTTMPTSEDDRIILAEVLQKYDRGRENLIPMLQEIQDRMSYLSPEAVAMAAAHLNLSENDVYGVATFYAQFRFHPPGRHRIKVCQGTACHVRGGGLVLDAIVRKIGISPGETSEDKNFSLERVACFGSCALPPVVVVDDKVYGKMTARKTEKLLEDLE
ncbi:NADH-quinone oxidoreductase subunit NuoE [Desulfonatronum parangueonense]